MNSFDLSKHTVVNKSIPKNAFDKYTNTKQKKLFVDIVSKIKWAYKISKETINLSGKEIKEIQVFEIQLHKKDAKISALLDIIDKSIPYHIVFVLTHANSTMLSVSKKHPHATNDDNSVIDWTFKSDWIKQSEFHYRLALKESIDSVFSDICFQISGKQKQGIDLKQLIEKEQTIKELKNEIQKLGNEITRSKQFNNKVDLNLKLQTLKQELDEFLIQN